MPAVIWLSLAALWLGGQEISGGAMQGKDLWELGRDLVGAKLKIGDAEIWFWPLVIVLLLMLILWKVWKAPREDKASRMIKKVKSAFHVLGFVKGKLGEKDFVAFDEGTGSYITEKMEVSKIEDLAESLGESLPHHDPGMLAGEDKSQPPLLC